MTVSKRLRKAKASESDERISDSEAFVHDRRGVNFLVGNQENFGLIRKSF